MPPRGPAGPSPWFSSAGLTFSERIDPDAHGLAIAGDRHDLALAFTGQGFHGGAQVELFARSREQRVHDRSRDLHLDLFVAAGALLVRPHDQVAGNFGDA